MADLDDEVFEVQQRMIAEGLRNMTRAPKLQPIGVCHNCNEKTKGVFCDAECRSDYEWANKKRC